MPPPPAGTRSRRKAPRPRGSRPRIATCVGAASMVDIRDHPVDGEAGLEDDGLPVCSNLNVIPLSIGLRAIPRSRSGPLASSGFLHGASAEFRRE